MGGVNFGWCNKSEDCGGLVEGVWLIFGVVMSNGMGLVVCE